MYAYTTPLTYADRHLPIGFVSRRDRNIRRALRAGETCEGSAMDRALSDGEWSIPVRCRYGKFALNHADNDFAKTTRNVEALYRQKQRAAELWGRPRQYVLPVVKEARLFLRWFRRYGDMRQWPAVVDALTTGPEHARPSTDMAA